MPHIDEYPPRNVLDHEGWDRYWERQSTSKWLLFNDSMIDDYWLARTMRRLGYRTILCAGNGLSLEPFALASAGFEVTAADLSSWAMNYLAKLKIKQQFLRRYFTSPGYMSLKPLFPLMGLRIAFHFNARKLMSELFNPAARGGPIPSFLAGDLFDPSFCAGPFDVIIERCTLQLYPPQERDDILRRLCDRLSRSGIFVSHCHMGWSGPGDDAEHMFRDWFQEHGFLIQMQRLGHLDRPRKNPGRIALLSFSTG